MRRFSSYGPLNPALHYYVPRQDLITHAYTQLVGEAPDAGGHYITVWAPRQRGKTWVMQQVVQKLKARGDFDVAILTLQSAKNVNSDEAVLDILVSNLRAWFRRDFPSLTTWKDLQSLFTADYFTRPLVLILDEFDAISESCIGAFANEFRDMYIKRINETDKISGEKSCLLHGLALIGVRSVLGIENQSGSPFNVQRSLHVPNLTAAEVAEMYHWYERESGQTVAPSVIARVFEETQGQPGLVSWLGEQLTETYNPGPPQPIDAAVFEQTYGAALHVLPNNNILNIISKARHSPYKELVLDLFRTAKKLPFRYDDARLNFLYTHGVVDWEQVAPGTYYTKFPCPFVQKRLFNYFAYELFQHMGRTYDPFEDLNSIITETHLNVVNLLRRYERYWQENRAWLLKDVPRRKTDLRVYEAVYHFNLYRYLASFLEDYGGRVVPEFPTGNGQVDLLLRYAGQQYALEVKSYANWTAYKAALRQTARYGQQLGLSEITLALFVDAVDDANRARHEAVYHDATTGVIVNPIFVVTGVNALPSSSPTDNR